MTTPRLNKRDWQIINAALALAEVSWDADDGYSTATTIRLEATRAKVHAALARYAAPYEWSPEGR